MSGIKAFLRDEAGIAISAEYVIFLAAIGILCVVGIVTLMGGLSNLFSVYAQYFQAFPAS